MRRLLRCSGHAPLVFRQGRCYWQVMVARWRFWHRAKARSENVRAIVNLSFISVLLFSDYFIRAFDVYPLNLSAKCNLLAKGCQTLCRLDCSWSISQHYQHFKVGWQDCVVVLNQKYKHRDIINQTKSNFIYIAHFIPEGNPMRFTEGRGGGVQNVCLTQIFQREAKKQIARLGQYSRNVFILPWLLWN